MATAKKQANQVVVIEDNALTAFGNERPDYIKEGPGRGNEDVSARDMVLPRIEIIQSESPILEINGDAAPGLLFNTVTNEVLGDRVYFVPIYYRTEYIVWKSKDEGGGFFGAFTSQGEAETRRREKIADGEKPEHMEIVDTPVHYGLLVDPQTKSTQQAVISMAKSKAKVSRKWNSVIQICGGDRFSRVYAIGTFKDQNAKGKTFQNFTVTPAGFAPESVYREAERLYPMLKQSASANHGDVIENDAEQPAHDTNI